MKNLKSKSGVSCIVDDDTFEWATKFTWRINRTGYFFRSRGIRKNGKGTCLKILLHRAVLNAPPNQIVDHKNGNILDNRRENLRFCTFSQNTWNNAKTTKPSSSVFKGVSWNVGCKKWQCGTTWKGSAVYLGLFDREVDAAIAYDNYARITYGDFARLNFSEKKTQ